MLARQPRPDSGAAAGPARAPVSGPGHRAPARCRNRALQRWVDTSAPAFPGAARAAAAAQQQALAHPLPPPAREPAALRTDGRLRAQLVGLFRRPQPMQPGCGDGLFGQKLDNQSLLGVSYYCLAEPSAGPANSQGGRGPRGPLLAGRRCGVGRPLRLRAALRARTRPRRLFSPIRWPISRPSSTRGGAGCPPHPATAAASTGLAYDLRTFSARPGAGAWHVPVLVLRGPRDTLRLLPPAGRGAVAAHGPYPTRRHRWPARAARRT
ncbi:MAG: hypothetical protein WKG07_48795 [Hymenobacter sp.]